MTKFCPQLKLFFVVLLCCWVDGATPAQAAELSGQILFVSGRPASYEGVEINCAGESHRLTTDSSGYFRLRVRDDSHCVLNVRQQFREIYVPPEGEWASVHIRE